MKPYLLLTPGPLTTSTTVKEAMMTDWCTWDEDYNLGIVEERICLRNLSRIDDKAFALQRQIESLKVKTVMRIEERSDDR